MRALGFEMQHVTSNISSSIPRMPYASATARSRRRYLRAFRGAEDLLSLALVIVFCVPEVFLKNVYLGPVPLPFAVFGCLAAIIVVHATLVLQHAPRLTVALIVPLIFMAIITNPRRVGFDMKFFAVDVWIFGGLIVGSLYATLRGRNDVLLFLRRGALLSAAALVLTAFALTTEVLATVSGGGVGARIYTQSLFNVSYILSVSLPILQNATRIRGTGRVCWSTGKTCVLGGLVIGVGIMTGTRSVLLVGLGSAVLCVLVNVRRRWPSSLSFVACLLLVAGAAVLQVDWQTALTSSPTSGWTRLARTSISDEWRYSEVQGLFAELGQDLILGAGFGSRFVSYNPGYHKGDSMAFAPHIGALTFLMKGGVLTFWALIVLPSIVGLISVLRPRSRLDTFKAAAWSGALLYLEQSWLSGGWAFNELFYYGLFLAICVGDRRSRAGERLVNNARISYTAPGRNAPVELPAAQGSTAGRRHWPVSARGQR